MEKNADPIDISCSLAFPLDVNDASSSSVNGDSRTAPERLAPYLTTMLDQGASDLFLETDAPPAYRVHGKVVRTRLPAPTAADMQRYIDSILTPVAKQRFENSPDLDMAYTLPGKGRFRINLFMHQGQLGLVARAIPLQKLSWDELGLPPVLREMADQKQGLILVVGPTGCGKSTTLAAMLQHIYEKRAEHIVTIEDPIEFVHQPAQGLVHQRQVGVDTESFATALRHVVRQNPDVVMLGELRDTDTIQTVFSAALTGHLILSTLHTSGVAQSIDRMLNYFDPAARRQAQTDLATTLVGIVSMRLIPRADGLGRVPAFEILRATPTVRRLLIENRLIELHDIMKRSSDVGMCTLNQSLVHLTNQGLIDAETATRYAPNREEYQLNIEGMYTGVDSIGVREEAQRLAAEKQAPPTPPPMKTQPTPQRPPTTRADPSREIEL